MDLSGAFGVFDWCCGGILSVLRRYFVSVVAEFGRSYDGIRNPLKWASYVTDFAAFETAFRVAAKCFFCVLLAVLVTFIKSPVIR